MPVACVLRSSDHERKSHEGKFQWPELGPVEAPDWDPKRECGNGLHGLPWGIGDWSLCRCQDPKAVWQVVEVEETSLVDLGGKVKFPRGTVIYSGTLSGALTLVTKRHFDQVLQKAATSGPRSPAATSGEAAPAATSGYAAPAATSGEAAPAATLGYHGKAKTGPNGSMILTYKDGSGRPRHVVAYAGENGIEPHVWYELSDTNEIVKCANQDVLTPEGFMRW